MNNNEMHKGFRHCKVCGYSAPPDLVKETRKHFSPHTYRCSRCGWHPEATPTEKDALAAWNTRADKSAPVERIEGLLNSIESAEHDYRVGNTVNPNDFDDVIKAARAHLNLHTTVEQIEGLADALACLDDDKPQYTYNLIVQFKEKYKCMPNVKFQEAARAYLKLQGGD